MDAAANKRQSQQARESLQEWRESLNGSRLPIFSQTVRDVKDISSSRATSARDLSEAIGRDASMAARVIQIANSPLFNLQNKNIDTINAAVVMVGFDAVREIAITVGVIEEMLKGHQHERVEQHLSRAFHAAAQARSFANRRDEKADEVFVAALLKEVGAMAFWSRAEREAVELDRELQQGTPPEEAERKVLGFALTELSRVLADDWQLGALVNDVLGGRKADRAEVQDVVFGHKVAQVYELYGWDSPQGMRLAQELAGRLDLKVRDLEALISANREEANGIASRFGVTPTQPRVCALQEQDGSADVARDTQAFFDALAQIANALENAASRDELMRLALQGLHRGLGMRHAYFALLNPARDQLTVKYIEGQQDEGSAGQSLVITAEPLFAQALERARVVTFDEGSNRTGFRFGGAGAAVAARIGGRAVGLLYAELDDGLTMDEEQISGFRQIGQQIGMILVQAGS